MRLIQRFRLSECATCPYAVKKTNKPLKCNWKEDNSNLKPCKDVKSCGCFADWFKELEK